MDKEKIVFNIGDIVEMKKKHPCGVNRWIIIRLGADIRIKCEGCSHSVLMPRRKFERRVKKKYVEKKIDTLPQEKSNHNSVRGPSVDVRESVEQTLKFNDESDLHKLGYRITGLNREQRWTILTTHAIPQLGLEKIVNIIASHIRNRKQQVNGIKKFHYAITEWEYDLGQLRKDYYNKLFNWPNY